MPGKLGVATCQRNEWSTRAVHGKLFSVGEIYHSMATRGLILQIVYKHRPYSEYMFSAQRLIHRLNFVSNRASESALMAANHTSSTIKITAAVPSAVGCGTFVSCFVSEISRIF